MSVSAASPPLTSNQPNLLSSSLELLDTKTSVSSPSSAIKTSTLAATSATISSHSMLAVKATSSTAGLAGSGLSSGLTSLGLGLLQPLTIKAQWGDDVRRLPIHNEELTYTELVLMMQRVFKLRPSDEVLLRYTDEDGDLVTLADDTDLSTAVRNARTLRLSLTVNGRPRSLDSDQVKWIRKELQQIRNRVTTLVDMLDSNAAPAPASVEQHSPQSERDGEQDRERDRSLHNGSLQIGAFSASPNPKAALTGNVAAAPGARPSSAASVTSERKQTGPSVGEKGTGPTGREQKQMGGEFDPLRNVGLGKVDEHRPDTQGKLGGGGLANGLSELEGGISRESLRPGAVDRDPRAGFASPPGGEREKEQPGTPNKQTRSLQSVPLLPQGQSSIGPVPPAPPPMQTTGFDAPPHGGPPPSILSPPPAPLAAGPPAPPFGANPTPPPPPGPPFTGPPGGPSHLIQPPPNFYGLQPGQQLPPPSQPSSMPPQPPPGAPTGAPPIRPFASQPVQMPPPYMQPNLPPSSHYNDPPPSPHTSQAPSTMVYHPSQPPTANQMNMGGYQPAQLMPPSPANALPVGPPTGTGGGFHPPGPPMPGPPPPAFGQPPGPGQQMYPGSSQPMLGVGAAPPPGVGAPPPPGPSGPPGPPGMSGPPPPLGGNPYTRMPPGTSRYPVGYSYKSA